MEGVSEVTVPTAPTAVDSSLNQLAATATLNCLIGCAAGEVTGMAIGTAFGFSKPATVVLAIGLAFLFGYTLASIPLVRSGLTLVAVIQLRSLPTRCRSRLWRPSTTPWCWRCQVRWMPDWTSCCSGDRCSAVSLSRFWASVARQPGDDPTRQGLLPWLAARLRGA
jgi:hypothetical protein